MRNKSVGWLIVGIGVVMTIIIWLFNSLIKDNLDLTCSHGPTCEMYSNLGVQTWISLIIVAIVLIIGFVIMFSRPEERTIIKTKKVVEKRKKVDKSKLDVREKQVVSILEEENAVFQKDLMEKLEIGKVGMTRLLDKLEAKQLIERKRRGMQNIVVLKR